MNLVDPLNLAQLLLHAHPELFFEYPSLALRYKLLSPLFPLITGVYTGELMLLVVSPYNDPISVRDMFSVLHLGREFKLLQQSFPQSFWGQPSWFYLGKEGVDEEEVHAYFHEHCHQVFYPTAHETIWAQAELKNLLSQIR